MDKLESFLGSADLEHINTNEFQLLMRDTGITKLKGEVVFKTGKDYDDMYNACVVMIELYHMNMHRLFECPCTTYLSNMRNLWRRNAIKCTVGGRVYMGQTGYDHVDRAVNRILSGQGIINGESEQINTLQVRLDNAELEQYGFHEEIARLVAENQEWERKCEELDEEHTKMETKIIDLNDQIVKKEVELNELRGLQQHQTGELGNNVEQIEQLEQDIESLKEDLVSCEANLQTRQTELQTELQTKTTALEVLSEKHITLKTKLEKLRNLYGDVKYETDNYVVEIEGLKTSVKKLKEELKISDGNHGETELLLNNTRDELEYRKGEYEKERSELTGIIEELEEKLKTSNKKHGEVKLLLNNTYKELEDRKIEYHEAERKSTTRSNARQQIIDLLKESEGKLKLDIGALRSRLSKYEDNAVSV